MPIGSTCVSWDSSTAQQRYTLWIVCSKKNWKVPLLLDKAANDVPINCELNILLSHKTRREEIPNVTVEGLGTQSTQRRTRKNWIELSMELRPWGWMLAKRKICPSRFEIMVRDKRQEAPVPSKWQLANEWVSWECSVFSIEKHRASSFY